MIREATVQRATSETRIACTVRLDGSGRTDLVTPIPFFTHMLDALCRHANLDLTLRVEGDTEIDQHHTVEDTGLVLGQALREALGEKRGIRRMGSAWVPMDDALGFAAIDLGGRPYFAFRGAFDKRTQGALELDLVPEFFRSLATEGRLNLHLTIAAGDNEHHKVEAVFKAVGRALAEAMALDPQRQDVVPSTKGSLT
ncbi:MAG: imidazoleglycerol-phosphate dehydratase HisB [Gemmatimonadales bacterium]